MRGRDAAWLASQGLHVGLGTVVYLPVAKRSVALMQVMRAVARPGLVSLALISLLSAGSVEAMVVMSRLLGALDPLSGGILLAR